MSDKTNRHDLTPAWLFRRERRTTPNLVEMLRRVMEDGSLTEVELQTPEGTLRLDGLDGVPRLTLYTSREVDARGLRDRLDAIPEDLRVAGAAVCTDCGAPLALLPAPGCANGAAHGRSQPEHPLAAVEG